MYRNQPEFNRICVKASRDRAYKRHIEALKKIQASKPSTPQHHRNYETQKLHSTNFNKDKQIRSSTDNMRKTNSSRNIQRPYTLHSAHAQKEEMDRISRENHKLFVAVQEAKPVLSRNDWYLHQIDHIYQTSKMSEFKKTIPISEVRSSLMKSRPHTTYHINRNSLPPLNSNRSSHKQHKPSEEKEESHTNSPTNKTENENENPPKLSVKIEVNEKESSDSSHHTEEEEETKEEEKETKEEENLEKITEPIIEKEEEQKPVQVTEDKPNNEEKEEDQEANKKSGCFIS